MRRNEFDLSFTEWDALINEYVYGKNYERDRQILKKAILFGKTYEQIAEEFDLSTERVKKIVHKRREVLFRHI